MCWKTAVRLADFRSSIAVRLSLLFAVVAVLVFVLIALLLNAVMQKELERHQLAQIQSRAADMRYMLLHVRPPNVDQRIKERIEALTPSDGRARYWLWSVDLRFCIGTDLPALLAQTRDQTGMVELETEGRRMRVLSQTFAANAVRPAVIMVVGIDVQPFVKTAQGFRLALWTITALGVALVSALGYWVARVGLAPVARLSLDVRSIGPDNRGQRLQLPTLPLELAQLGASFNAALDRLERAYRQLASFNDDVAHELRTPLGNLIGQTQVALTRERDAGHLQEILLSNLEELERLRLIVSDMLFLARADQGERASRLGVVSIAQEVHKTVEFMELLLDDAGLTVQVHGDQMAAIETALFRRAVTNLLQNAIQYARVGTVILTEIAKVDQQIQITVSNQGAQIAQAHIPRIFDRFFRADVSRTNAPERAGHGLGLAIVKAVASMHGGGVFAYSTPAGTAIGFSVACDLSALGAVVPSPGQV